MKLNVRINVVSLCFSQGKNQLCYLTNRDAWNNRLYSGKTYRLANQSRDKAGEECKLYYVKYYLDNTQEKLLWIKNFYSLL